MNGEDENEENHAGDDDEWKEKDEKKDEWLNDLLLFVWPFVVKRSVDKIFALLVLCSLK